MSKETVLLLGYGDIASRLAGLLDRKQYQVEAIRRSVCSGAADMTMHQADCRDVESMATILASDFDVIVITLTPTEMSDQGYKAGYVDTVKTVLNVLKTQQQKPKLILFISSTSVYGQQDASWIDEESVTEPSSYSGKRLLEAEQLLNDYQQEHGQAICCVRFSGIYGPGRRRLIEQVIAGKGSPIEPVLYSNRIHADDCAGILAHLIQRQKTQKISSLYLATDCEPVPLSDVKQWIAQTLHLPDDHLKESVSSVPERMLRSSKRCSNKRVLDTGYRYLYPNFRLGYGEMLKAD